MPNRSFFTTGLLILNMFFCVRCGSLSPGKTEAYQTLITAKKCQISLNPGGTDTLQLFYTGCGGMVINKGNQSVLIDPFYSNKRFFAMQVSKTASNKKNIGALMKQVELEVCPGKAIQAVLLAHSHYDHMMDLPFLIKEGYVSDNCKIYGSASARNALAAVIKRNYDFHVPLCQSDTDPQWTYLNKNCRFSVVKADHAPHFKLFGKTHHQMKGEIDEQGVKGFDTIRYKAKYTRWLEGETYSFMIDYLNDEGKKELRLFIQSSSCTPPAGIPLLAMGTDSVDIALIGIASSSLIADYPVSLLKRLKARKIIFIHWEDFFGDYASAPKTVRGTDFSLFFSRLDTLYQTNVLKDTNKFFMPGPGTLFKISY